MATKSFSASLSTSGGISSSTTAYQGTYTGQSARTGKMNFSGLAALSGATITAASIKVTYGGAGSERKKTIGSLWTSSVIAFSNSETRTDSFILTDVKSAISSGTLTYTFKDPVTTIDSGDSWTKNYCSITSATLTVTYTEAPSVTAPSLISGTFNNGTVGISYNDYVTVDGDTPITWTKYSGTLPPGLSLSAGNNTAYGYLKGTPTTSGTYSFTLKAANSSGSVTKSFSLTINSSTSTTYTYSIQFNGNGNTGGSVPSSISKSGTSTSVVMGDIGSSVPTKTGYTFRGWSASSSYSSKRIVYTLSNGGGADANGVSATQTSSSWTYADYCSYTGGSTSSRTLTLYAQWEANSSSVPTITYYTSSSTSTNVKVNYYNGSDWIPIKTIHYYNGSDWIEVGNN